MAEYIPKDKVLELWWYWKFIEAYDQTKAMKGIELDDYVPREWHNRVCEEMAKRHTADRPNGDFVSRRCLLAEIDDLADEFSEVDENGLHSERWCGILDAKGVIVNAPSVADRPKGEWIWGNEKKAWHKCSVCGEPAYSFYDELADNVEELFNFCPWCGADMRGEDNVTE